MDIKIGIALIHTRRNAVVNHLHLCVGVKVGLAQGVNVAESKERFEADFGLAVSVEQSVADKDSRLTLDKDFLFFQNNAANTVNECRYRVGIEFGNILVAFGLVVVTLIFMQSQIELAFVLNDSLVERRKQHVAATIDLRQRAHQHSVILTVVAANQGCKRVRSSAVGPQHFFGQGILKIYKFCFVKL